MKALIKVEKEVDIKEVVICVRPRYIGDTEDDDMSPDFPGLCYDKISWTCCINIDDGRIEGWPAGRVESIHIKVCDAGSYTLYDADGISVAMIDGYVPNELIPGEYGDYIIMNINSFGRIENWPSNPSVRQFFEE